MEYTCGPLGLRYGFNGVEELHRGPPKQWTRCEFYHSAVGPFSLGLGTRKWRNGRRTSLRGWRSQERGGSNPPFRTILIDSVRYVEIRGLSRGTHCDGAHSCTSEKRAARTRARGGNGACLPLGAVRPRSVSRRTSPHPTRRTPGCAVAGGAQPGVGADPSGRDSAR